METPVRSANFGGIGVEGVDAEQQIKIAAESCCEMSWPITTRLPGKGKLIALNLGEKASEVLEVLGFWTK